VQIFVDTIHPIAFAGRDSTLTCSVPKIKLGIPAVAGNTYAWTPATGLNDAAIAQPLTEEPLSYTLTVTTSRNGCQSASSVNIRQNITTAAAVAGPDPLLTCAVTSVQIGAPAIAGTAYRWSPAAGLSNPIVAQPSANKAGTYTLTVINLANGCTSNDEVTVKQDTTSPGADAGADKALTCVTKAVGLGAPVRGGHTYSWDPSPALTSTTIAQPVAKDTGTFVLTITRISNGCSSVDSVTVLKDTIQPVADAGADQQFGCPHTALSLGGQSTPGYSYYWSKAKGLHATDVANPLTDSAGTFSLYVINTKNGCKSLSDTVVIYDKNCECTFFVPQAFSPNNDKTNDILRALKYCDDYRDFSFSIFNRWGEEVYHTNSLDEGWDGFYKSESIQDTYAWVIQYFDVLNNEKKIVKGTVALLK
jgi:gliding motility-associated-like protein